LLEQETEAIDEKTVRRTNGNGGPCAMLGPLRETRWAGRTKRVAQVLGVSRRTPYRTPVATCKSRSLQNACCGFSCCCGSRCLKGSSRTSWSIST